MWTPQFESFVAPARRNPQLWRVVLGTALIAAIYIGVFLGMVALIGVLLRISTPPVAGDTPDPWFRDLLMGRNPTGVVLMLLSFGGLTLGTWAAARWLHGRRFRTLLGEHVWRDFLPAALITMALGGLSAFLALGDDIALVPNTPLPIFLTFLPAALLALAVQTGAEEIVFRGYLQTQLAARFASPLVWMLIPSLLFGLLHTNPGVLIETGALAPNDGYMFAATTLVGLLAADLTRVTGGLGAAWGLHFANNVQAMLIVSLDDVLSGLSLWKTPFDRQDLDVLPMLLLQDMVLLVVIWAAIRLWLARRRRRSSAVA